MREKEPVDPAIPPNIRIERSFFPSLYFLMPSAWSRSLFAALVELTMLILFSVRFAERPIFFLNAISSSLLTLSKPPKITSSRSVCQTLEFYGDLS